MRLPQCTTTEYRKQRDKYTDLQDVIISNKGMATKYGAQITIKQSRMDMCVK
jgi:hypothetical protein